MNTKLLIAKKSTHTLVNTTQETARKLPQAAVNTAQKTARNSMLDKTKKFSATDAEPWYVGGTYQDTKKVIGVKKRKKINKKKRGARAGMGRGQVFFSF
jgi:hypothetical protein